MLLGLCSSLTFIGKIQLKNRVEIWEKKKYKIFSNDCVILIL